MTANVFHDPFHVGAWPEPLIIDVIASHLEQHPFTVQSRRELARRHAATLRDMVADRDGGWRDARSALEATYTALGFTRRTLQTIDCAVFTELTRLVGSQHRTSPRRRQEAAVALRAALARLTGETGGRRVQQPCRALAA